MSNLHIAYFDINAQPAHSRHQVLNKLGYCMLDFPYIQLFHSNDRHRCTDLVLAIHHSYLVDATSKDYIGQGGRIHGSILVPFLEEIFDHEKAETATKAADYASMMEYALTHEYINVVAPGVK